MFAFDFSSGANESVINRKKIDRQLFEEPKGLRCLSRTDLPFDDIKKSPQLI